VKMTVLLGTLQDSCPLSVLKGHAELLRKIFCDVDDMSETHIKRDEVAYKVCAAAACHERSCLSIVTICASPEHLSVVSVCHRVAQITETELRFPPPQGLRINMMPIKYCREGNYATVPRDCAQYITMIKQCDPIVTDDHIMYLTIHEERVPVGKPHRRPGVHIEQLGSMLKGGSIGVVDMHERYFGYCHHWGGGRWEREVPLDGIYCASNVADSCRVWPVLLTTPQEVTDIHGGLEHFREYLGSGETLPANALCWMCDRTPHETLPLQAPADDPTAEFVYRQFFRLVVGQIAVWYSKHNTANPCGLQPDAPISYKDKFARKAAV
jgi:hypothetical protein